MRIEELEAYIEGLESKCKASQEAIDQLSKKLEEEKKTNMRWIKLHESQMEADQK